VCEIRSQLNILGAIYLQRNFENILPVLQASRQCSRLFVRACERKCVYDQLAAQYPKKTLSKVQYGEDAFHALSFRSLFVKEP